jgi:hypothetical protein
MLPIASFGATSFAQRIFLAINFVGYFAKCGQGSRPAFLIKAKVSHAKAQRRKEKDRSKEGMEQEVTEETEIRSSLRFLRLLLFENY